MDKTLSEKIANALYDVLDCKGLICESLVDKEFIDLNNEKECNIYTKVDKDGDKHMVAYVLINMFKEGKIEFTNEAYIKPENKAMSDVDYIKKLLEGDENEKN